MSKQKFTTEENLMAQLSTLRVSTKTEWRMSQDNPGITQPSGESQGITLVVVYILAYSVYIQYICDLHPDI